MDSTLMVFKRSFGKTLRGGENWFSMGEVIKRRQFY